MAVNSRASRVIRQEHPPLLAGVAVAGLSVAAITALIFPLRQVVAGVVERRRSTCWRCCSSPTVLGAAARARDERAPARWRSTSSTCRRPAGSRSPTARNWVALIVFLVAAVVASAVAELARTRAVEAEQRRREADLAAELARPLLGGARVETTLADAAQRLAEALALASARSSSDSREGDGDGRRVRLRRRRRAGRHAGRSRRVSARTRERLADAGRPVARGAARRRAGARAAAGRGGRDRRRCAAATSSRPRCCARSRTTCARR